MTNLPSETLRFADLSSQRATAFKVTPDAEAQRAIAAALGVDAARKIAFAGTIAPQGATDWRLTATLGATVVQPCVTTLAPVTTRIDEPVERTFVADLPEVDGLEVEMPEDDTLEQLPAAIDLYAILLEALSLAIPAFPRADGAALGDVSVTEPGQTPMTDADAKPFAGLAALKETLKNKGDETG